MTQTIAASAASSQRRRLWMLALGAVILVWILRSNDLSALIATLARVKWGALAVVGAHLLVVLAAGLGWSALLDAAERPALAAVFRLRLVKEAINGLLPVAQVGGDVVRARLAAGPRLPLATSAASCLVDIAVSLACLAFFVLAGLAAAASTLADPRLERMALQLAVAGAVVVAGVVVAERLGALRLIDKAVARSEGVLGGLQGVGAEVARLQARRGPIAASLFWHLLSWVFGAAETWVALRVVGAHAGWREAFVLESLIQGARALGFAIPGALGVQEGGYLLICASLGLPPGDALALSLLRRVRELSLGVLGLVLWRSGKETPS